MATETFTISVPEGYDETDKEVWRASITEALNAITDDAHNEVKFNRTYRSMVDAGLGEDGEGNFRG